MSSSQSGTRPRIRFQATKLLLIDDSDIIAEAVKSSLEDSGVEVLVRTTAVGAQATVLRERPDVVLVDVNMPLMSGDAFVRSLREHPALRDTIVILTSSMPENSLSDLARSCGANGSVVKSELLSLNHHLAAWLSRSARAASTSNSDGPILIACGTGRSAQLAIALRNTHMVRVTRSGHDALRMMLSSFDNIGTALIGTDLPDVSADTMVRAATRRDPSWARRIAVVIESGEVPSWAKTFACIDAETSMDSLHALLVSLRNAA